MRNTKKLVKHTTEICYPGWWCDELCEVAVDVVPGAGQMVAKAGPVFRVSCSEQYPVDRGLVKATAHLQTDQLIVSDPIGVMQGQEIVQQDNVNVVCLDGVK